MHRLITVCQTIAGPFIAGTEYKDMTSSASGKEMTDVVRAEAKQRFSLVRLKQLLHIAKAY
jgi:hypothetical protein